MHCKVLLVLNIFQSVLKLSESTLSAAQTIHQSESQISFFLVLGSLINLIVLYVCSRQMCNYGICVIISCSCFQGECFSDQIEYLDTRTMTWHCPKVKVGI